MGECIEILAPAGSWESLRAAVAAGADAVYIGGKRFGARAYADNLSEEELVQAIDYVHLHGRKLYLTVNTLLKEQEMGELYAYLLPLYRAGLDAVLVQDVGVLHFLRGQFPDLPVHASTQMTVTGADGVRFLTGLGVTRVVLARELSLGEIRQIIRETGAQIECFVHGALCYCYSGQCLLSSFLGGRSGNRGRCAQPCRLPYRAEGEEKPAYLMSLKDICTLELIPELAEAGIASFKIEGRMKKPEYVALVTAMYRNYVDRWLRLRGEALERGETAEEAAKRFHVEPADRQALLELYNRGGFHSGYYHQKNGREMVSLKRPNHAGVPAVKVQSQRGRTLTLQALTELEAGDVIELSSASSGPRGTRRGEDPLSEKERSYTCPENVAGGGRLEILLPPGVRAERGTVFPRVRSARLIREVQERFLIPEYQEKIKGIFRLSVGEPATLEVSCGEDRVVIRGDEGLAAQRQPLDPGRVRAQLQKTGGTPFVFAELDVQITGEVFLPMQSLNELRRNALRELEACRVRRYHREMPEPCEGREPCGRECPKQCAGRAASPAERASGWKGLAEVGGRECPDPCADNAVASGKKPGGRVRGVYATGEERIAQRIPFSASALTKEQLRVLLEENAVGRVYADCAVFPRIWEADDLREWTEKAHRRGKELYLTLPLIFREETRRRWEAAGPRILEAGWDGVLARNYESFFFLREHGFTKPVRTDYNLYQYNRLAQAFWREQGAAGFTAPLELTAQELRSLDLSRGELVIYGYLPLMVSAGCIRRTLGGCRGEAGETALFDRYQKRFVVSHVCDDCYNVLYNPVPLYLGDLLAEAGALGPEAFRLQFTRESADEVRQVLALCGAGAPWPGKEFTRGHWKKGVQ